MSWSTLPEELWKHILHFVPTKHRLEKCSRVSRALHQAAIAATQHARLVDDGEYGDFNELYLDLCQWMHHHGQHLTSLHLETNEDTPPAQVLQLPCPNLLRAVLYKVPVQLGASSSHPGTLHSCTQLQQLCLDGCLIIDGRSGLAAL
jgi:hypothetical protein